jgi:hypothetical protein
MIVALHAGLLADAKNVLVKLKAATDENNKEVNDADFTRQANAANALFESQLAARSGDFQAAKGKAEENRKLMEGDPNLRKLEGYYGALGLIDLLQKNYNGAVENYRKSNLALISNKYYLALALEGAGDRAQAKKIFKDVAEFNFNTAGFALVRKDALKRSA